MRVKQKQKVKRTLVIELTPKEADKFRLDLVALVDDAVAHNHLEDSEVTDENLNGAAALINALMEA